jgi:hypothetical protein
MLLLGRECRSQADQGQRLTVCTYTHHSSWASGEGVVLPAQASSTQPEEWLGIAPD